MRTAEHAAVRALKQSLKDDPHLDFASFLETQSIDLGDEDLVSDLIDAHGRSRRGLGLEVELWDYLRAIPELPDSRTAFDTAIEHVLRHMSGADRPSDAAVSKLIDQYPDHADRIRIAGVLGQAMWTTSELQELIAHPTPRRLPCDIGPPLASGRARYELRELLGTGTSGSVYQAVDRHLSERDHPAWVAFKIVAASDDADIASVLEEARLARRIDHPAVVRVIDHGVTEEHEPYVIYEFIGTQALDRWYAEGGRSRDARLAARLVAAVSRGAQAAHARGLVHGDIKPSNIVIDGTGSPRLADFGSAVRIATLPPEQETRGTFAFMSPEQFRREPEASAPTSDVYALGGLLFYLLTGRAPNGEAVDEVYQNLGACAAERSTQRILELGPDTHDALGAICRRALASRPDERYPSADALASDLEAWLDHRPLEWTTTSGVRRAAMAYQRHPIAGTAAAMMAVGVIVALVVVAKIAGDRGLAINVAEQQVVEAEKREAVHKQYVSQREAQVQAVVRTAYEALSQTRPDTDYLRVTALIESLLGPIFAADNADAPSWREGRIERAQAHVAKSPDTLEGLLWQTCLAFWLTADGRGADAAETVSAAHDRWAALLAPGDPWLGHMALLSACAEVAALAEQHQEGLGALTDSDRAAADRLAELLATETTAFPEGRAGDPLHLLVLRSARLLHGPRLLDNPKRAADYQDRHLAVQRGPTGPSEDS